MAAIVLRPIGRIFTGYAGIEDCPRNLAPGLPHSRICVDAAFRPGLLGLIPGRRYDILYWLHLADRSDVFLVQSSRRSGEPAGVFAKCSPHRPNPIGLGRVVLHAIDGGVLEVDGLDCIDSTLLLDIKPAVL